MFSVDLSQNVQQEIESIAREHGFENVAFYPEYESGRSRSLRQADTRDPKSIAFNYLFLRPASKLYRIHPELLRRVTKVVCLHERKHYEFPDPRNADDWKVQEKASQAYGEDIEFAILDALLLFYEASHLDDKYLGDLVSDYLNEFYWLSPVEMEAAVAILSNKNFYQKRSLRKFAQGLLTSQSEAEEI
jgi:hypothetical protein